MSGNAKFRWFLLAPILLATFVVVNSPVISSAGELEDALEDAKEKVRLNPDQLAYLELGVAYSNLGQYQEAIA